MMVGRGRALWLGVLEDADDLRHDEGEEEAEDDHSHGGHEQGIDHGGLHLVPHQCLGFQEISEPLEHPVELAALLSGRHHVSVKLRKDAAIVLERPGEAGSRHHLLAHIHQEGLPLTPSLPRKGPEGLHERNTG
jgi:hypothetical protein